MVDCHLPVIRYLLPPKGLKLSYLHADLVVVGGGIAGLTAVIAAAERGRHVVLVTKDSLEESNSFYAQGGVAAVLHATDSFDLHFQDTMRTGDGLSNEEIVRIVVREGPAAIQRLIGFGSTFDSENGVLALSREGGHSAPRVVHSRDSTGMEIQRVLIDKARSLPNVSIHERWFALDLLQSEGRCAGILISGMRDGFCAVLAPCTILTSGGAGQIYRETTNPEVACGDGTAMAFRAGARLRDMEFFQFHPTVLYLPGAPRILISETARGEGGILRDGRGNRFMSEYHPAAELAPRDVVSRAILKQMVTTQDAHIYLDMTHLDAAFLRARFPKILEFCARYAIDITKDSIPVRPAAHYGIGGVVADAEGRTTLPGLYACGEVASSRLHGANRLGSNSLLEGLVFGWRAALAASAEIETSETFPVWRPDDDRVLVAGAHMGIDVWDLRNSLKALMWHNVGIERNAEKLGQARELMEIWARLVARTRFATPAGWELANMLTFAQLVTLGAQHREESRGVHYRTDFPERDDARWRRSITIERRSFEDAL